MQEGDPGSERKCTNSEMLAVKVQANAAGGYEWCRFPDALCWLFVLCPNVEMKSLSFPLSCIVYHLFHSHAINSGRRKPDGMNGRLETRRYCCYKSGQDVPNLAWLMLRNQHFSGNICCNVSSTSPSCMCLDAAIVVDLECTVGLQPLRSCQNAAVQKKKMGLKHYIG